MKWELFFLLSAISKISVYIYDFFQNITPIKKITFFEKLHKEYYVIKQGLVLRDYVIQF